MKQMVKSKCLLGVALCCMGLSSEATAQAVEFKPVIVLGYDFGSDILASGNLAGSAGGVANQGYALNGGVVMVTGSFETQATLGYKFGDGCVFYCPPSTVSFKVVPVELMAFYRTSDLLMGAGYSYHYSPRLVVDIPGTSATYKFDNALGVVVQIGRYWKFQEIWVDNISPISIDLRYTAIKYQQSGVANPPDIDGDSVGLYMGFQF